MGAGGGKEIVSDVQRLKTLWIQDFIWADKLLLFNMLFCALGTKRKETFFFVAVFIHFFYPFPPNPNSLGEHFLSSRFHIARRKASLLQSEWRGDGGAHPLPPLG